MCDWNSDGRLDLITGERLGFYTIFLRKEDSTLTNAGRIQAHGNDMVADTNSWPMVCDWNLDGRKDLLIGQEGLNYSSNVNVYLNQGTDAAPVFEDSTPVLHNGSPFADRRTVPLLLELDGDGKRDLVLGEWYSSVRLYRNVGTDTNPLFNTYINLVQPDPDSFLNGNPPRINFTDWDGDGDLDMITCDYYGSVFLRRNITPAALEEAMNDERGVLSAGATIVHNVLFLPDSPLPTPYSLLSLDGRRLMSLHPGSNDVSSVAPGAYFIREEGLGAWGQGLGRTQKVLKTE